MTGALADVPTWRELGYDVVVAQWRGVMGPKGMPDAQVAYWERTLKRMTEADEWKRDLEKNFWVADFMGARELRQFMENDNATLKRFLGELGLTDKKRIKSNIYVYQYLWRLWRWPWQAGARMRSRPLRQAQDILTPTNRCASLSVLCRAARWISSRA